MSLAQDFHLLPFISPGKYTGQSLSRLIQFCFFINKAPFPSGKSASVKHLYRVKPLSLRKLFFKYFQAGLPALGSFENERLPNNFHHQWPAFKPGSFHRPSRQRGLHLSFTGFPIIHYRTRKFSSVCTIHYTLFPTKGK
jgi:hypothetical protein